MSASDSNRRETNGDERRPGSGTTFTGRRRRKRTRWTVKASDTAAHLLITVGGMGTILAVTTVFAFLAWVVLPLLRSARVEPARVDRVGWLSSPWREAAFDEYQTIGWLLDEGGMLHVIRIDDGRTIATRELIEPGGAKITASAHSVDRTSVSLGYSDGTVRIGTIGFQTRFPRSSDLPESVRNLAVGDRAVHDEGVLERTPQGQFRFQTVEVDLTEPIEVADSPVVRIDHVRLSSGPVFVLLTEEGQLELNTIRQRENLLTGEVTQTARQQPLPLPPRIKSPPDFLALAGNGDMVYAAWKDGRLARIDARGATDPIVAEEIDLVEDPGATLTCATLLLGRSTILTGDSTGGVSAWFPVRSEEASTSDGARLTPVHRLGGSGAPVTCLGSSARGRMVAAGYADGRLRIYQVTTEECLADLEVDSGNPLSLAAFAPKDDGLIATAGRSFWRAPFRAGHPETTVGSLFLPVWYEGYPGPRHVWQSGGGTASLEPKLGLWPLVFGTLKASFYSMLVGAPIALLAAIYTSEFLHPRLRQKIKPTIELMASLPSVVLGFLAALVIAPYVEKVVPAVLASLVTLPLVLILGALLWQLLPGDLLVRLQPWRLPVILLTLPVGVAAAAWLGPWVERWLFSGDLMAWLDGQVGSGLGGWVVLVTPLAAFAAVAAMVRWVNPWIRLHSAHGTRGRHAMLGLVKFFVGSATAVGLALVVAGCLTGLGLDPRGSFFGTYDQRNALVVGFVMGFAIIPIIYTIADDALTSVPMHLRYGSLGAGATPWQTAFRIVIPTAVSGLFSALMVGLGRAVGETMIVLMAAGNTPVLELNIFNGFRTLAANIAVELPEAARNSTHYRTLFLAALTLFVLTFLVNTVAETIRLRFRRRAYQL